VELGDIRAFLPGSLVDVRPVRDTSYLEGKELEFKVIKLDQKRNNVVVSRRAVVETEYSAEREELLNSIEEGKTIKGVVKNLNVSPSNVVTLGDEVEVMILDIDPERRRISLGMKQCKANPWDEFSATHNKGDKVSGVIKSITDFGVFVGLNGEIDGLVHMSDVSWEVEGVEAIRDYKKGDTIEAVVLSIDPERERISLGIKQMEQDPVSTYM
ncbi:MAG: S1 RNA-binding domain-containing protein, partial [Halomonas sp.]